MLKGTIYVTDDINMAMNLAPTHTIICVSGETHNYQEFINVTNASVASVLLPPYEAVMQELDGNLMAFKDIYYTYLSTNEPHQIIALILRALFNGKNILLYCTKDESKMNYMKFLLMYLYENFGIIVGTQNNPFGFDPRYELIILNVLYLNNLMNADEYLSNYPIIHNSIDDPNILLKLANELKPFILNPSLEAYRQYFINYLARLRNGIKAISPIERADM